MKASALQSSGETSRVVHNTVPIGPARTIGRTGDDVVDQGGVKRAVDHQRFGDRAPPRDAARQITAFSAQGPGREACVDANDSSVAHAGQPTRLSGPSDATSQRHRRNKAAVQSACRQNSVASKRNLISTALPRTSASPRVRNRSALIARQRRNSSLHVLT